MFLRTRWPVHLGAWGAAVVVFPACVWAWGVTHSDTTRAALDMLPAWQQQVWARERVNLIKTYCTLTDMAAGGSPEVVKNVRPYLYYDRRGWLLHYFPSESYEANRTRATRAFEWVVARIIANLEAGETDKAARFAGGISHTLQDASSPIHSLEGPDDLRGIINLLHAPPPEDPYYNVWAAFWVGGTPDRTKLVTAGYRPRLLGTSPPEIAWRLYDRYRDVLTHTRRHLLPAIDALYSDRPRQGPEWQRLWDPMAVVVSQVLADLYHTCMCVAHDRIDPDQLAALARVRIEGARPVEAPLRLAPPYQYATLARDVALDAAGKPVPLALRMADGEARTFEHGFSTGAASECLIAYDVPPGVFDAFTARVGLHPRLAANTPAAGVTVEVRFSGKQAFRAGPFESDSAAVTVNVPVLDGGKLELISRATGSGPNAASNVLVWADTVLARSPDAPCGADTCGPVTPPRAPSVRRPSPAQHVDGWGSSARRAILQAAARCLTSSDAKPFIGDGDPAMPWPLPEGVMPALPRSLADYDSTVAVFESSIRSIAGALRTRRPDDVVRYSVALATALADRASPLKCLDGEGGAAYRAFAQLFPAPPRAPFASAVSVLGIGQADIKPNVDDCGPRLLGTSPAEAAFHARQSYVGVVGATCHQLADLVNARYAGDAGKADAILADMAGRVARLLADVYYTCACLARDRFEPDETAWLDEVDLTRVAWLAKPGYAGGPYRTQPIVYGASLQKEGRKRVPLELRLIEDGREVVRTFQRGLGVGGHAKWAFKLKIPPSVFDTLDLYLGMHATLGNVPSYGKKHGQMQLSVALDGKMLFDSGVLTPAEPGAHATLDVTVGGMLELRMADRSGHWANYGNQVVYGQPRLVRSATAPRGLD